MTEDGCIDLPYKFTCRDPTTPPYLRLGLFCECRDVNPCNTRIFSQEANRVYTLRKEGSRTKYS